MTSGYPQPFKELDEHSTFVVIDRAIRAAILANKPYIAMPADHLVVWWNGTFTETSETEFLLLGRCMRGRNVTPPTRSLQGLHHGLVWAGPCYLGMSDTRENFHFCLLDANHEGTEHGWTDVFQVEGLGADCRNIVPEFDPLLASAGGPRLHAMRRPRSWVSLTHD